MWRDESGAVTIDWVALTAGILILGVAVVHTVFQSGVAPLTATITDTLTGIEQRCVAIENSGTSLESTVETLEDC